MKVFAIIVCYNEVDLIRQCLRSLEAQDYPDLFLIVVDNGSTDGSVEVVRQEFPSVMLVEAGDNLGYVGGNNLGMRIAIDRGADCVFLVNSDTILDPSCVRILARDLSANPQIGVIGPMVFTWNSWEIISSAGGIVLWQKADSQNVGAGEQDAGQYLSRDVDFITGCGIMVRCEAIEKAGMLDTKYFIYWEETDWCVRIHKAGFRIYFERDAKMQHKTSIYKENLSPTNLYLSLRNRFLFFSRHTHGVAKFVALAHALHGGIREILALKKSGKNQHAKAMWVGLQHAILGRWGKVNPGLWR